MVEASSMTARNLPKGFSRLKSGSLRVQIRANGHAELRTFPLLADTADERRRQMAEASAWAGEIRRRIVSASHVSHRDAEKTTLATVLQRYEREGLVGDPANVAKERPRIATLLADPISKKTLAQLRKTDIVALRDRLIHAGWLRKMERAARKAEQEERGKQRASEIRSLPKLTSQLKDMHVADDRRKLETQLNLIIEREKIGTPARTTVANVVQLVTRALKFAAQTIDGVPDLSGVPMPTCSPGRDRRVSDDEFRKLLTSCPEANPPPRSRDGNKPHPVRLRRGA